MFNDTVEKERVQEIFSEMGTEILKEYTKMNLYLVRIKDNNISETIKEFETYEEIKYVEPNYLRKITK